MMANDTERIKPTCVKNELLTWGDERTWLLAATNEVDAREEAGFWGLRICGHVHVYEQDGQWYAKDYFSIGD